MMSPKCSIQSFICVHLMITDLLEKYACLLSWITVSSAANPGKQKKGWHGGQKNVDSSIYDLWQTEETHSRSSMLPK